MIPILGSPIETEPTHKDVILALFGGSIGIGGLLLVFQAFVVSAYNNLPGLTPQTRRDWYRNVTDLTLAVLLLSFVSTLVSLNWLLRGNGYSAAIVLFVLTIAAVAGIAIAVSRKLVR